MNSYFNRLDIWQKGIGIGLIAVVAILILVRSVYLPAWARIMERKAILYDLQVKVADAQVVMPRLSEQGEKLQKAKQQLLLVNSQFSSGRTLGRILERISEEARNSRLDLSVSQEFAQSVDLGPRMKLEAIPLTLKLKGRYAQLGEFLGRLSEAPFVSMVKQLSVMRSSGEESADLSAEVVLEVFFAADESSS